MDKFYMDFSLIIFDAFYFVGLKFTRDFILCV